MEPTNDDTNGLLYTAEECINCLNNIEESERKDFVAWMILATRGGVKIRWDRISKKEVGLFEKFTRNS